MGMYAMYATGTGTGTGTLYAMLRYHCTTTLIHNCMRFRIALNEGVLIYIQKSHSNVLEVIHARLYDCSAPFKCGYLLQRHACRSRHHSN